MFPFNKNNNNNKNLCLCLLLIMLPLAFSNHLVHNEEMSRVTARKKYSYYYLHHHWHWLSIVYWIKVKIVIVTFFLTTWLLWGIRYLFDYPAKECTTTTMVNPAYHYG
uniref:Uncharacterized protein n=1 Tax=Glossina palpalis gambiensis TaxID=67801 RepID=A0A1B0BI78_9MUSC